MIFLKLKLVFYLHIGTFFWKIGNSIISFGKGAKSSRTLKENLARLSNSHSMCPKAKLGFDKFSETRVSTLRTGKSRRKCSIFWEKDFFRNIIQRKKIDIFFKKYGKKQLISVEVFRQLLYQKHMNEFGKELVLTKILKKYIGVS